MNELKEQSEREIREKNESILRLNNLLSENFEKQDASSGEAKALQEQVASRDREIAAKNKELDEVTLLLSNRNKEILVLRKEAEKGNQSSTEELARLKEHVRSLEADHRTRREQSESLLERLREFTPDFATAGWETSLTRVLTQSTQEHINFLRAAPGQRLLFMPHSPGVYVALVLKQVSDILVDSSTS